MKITEAITALGYDALDYGLYECDEGHVFELNAVPTRGYRPKPRWKTCIVDVCTAQAFLQLKVR